MYRKLVIVLIAFTAIALSGCADGDGVEMNSGEEPPFGNLGAFSIERIEPSVALPGDEVTIFGPGLNAEVDLVIAGNVELTVNSSIDVALSAITGEDESDAVDGQLRFTIPENAEVGVLPIKVARSDMESNVVDIEIVAADDVDEGDNVVEGVEGKTKIPTISMSYLDDTRAINYHCPVGHTSGTENCSWAGENSIQLSVYKMEWNLPEDATEITLYTPAYGIGFINKVSRDGSKKSVYVADGKNLFTDADKNLLVDLIEGYDGLDAANYRAAEADNFEKCFDRKRDETKGSIPLICKKFNIDSDLDSLKTVTYDLSEQWEYGFVVKHTVLEFVDGDGNPQTVKADIPIN